MDKPLTGQSSIPQISNKDLLDFQESHFGQTANGVFASLLSGQQLASVEEDGAVYYPDGVRRTLTDEQIAIFRWSEEQAIIRKKIKEEEASNENKSNKIVSSIEQPPFIPGIRDEKYKDNLRVLYGAGAEKISQLEDQVDANYQRAMEYSKFKYWPSVGLRI